ncbi:MAG: PQQ-like beta-propeller repeat protein [Acidimicrobiia bacterium]|nr:PQQ-like beta-propeller repeat protein [Acidimicrobiia bacterium]
MRAIDARTGRDVWTVDLEEIGGWSVVAGPVLAGDLVVVALDSGHLLAVEQATGLDRWSWSSQTYSISDIVAVDDRVYVTTRTGDGVAVVALDGSGGTQRWRTDLGDVDGAFSAQVSATPSAVLVGVEGTDRAVMFGVATDGRLGWELDLGDTHLTGRPAIDGATAVLATQDDDAVVSIIGLPVATGEETWRWTRRPETGTTYQTPVRALAVSGEWVYAAGPELLLLDRATGEVSGTLPGYSAVPFVVGDELVGCPVRAALGRTADTRTVHMSDEDGDAVSCYDLVTVANGAYYAVDDGDLRALG